MNIKTKIFMDTEFTGLIKDTSLISIGLVSECGKTFYAEATDYDKDKINDWIENNVISKLTLKEGTSTLDKNDTLFCGTKKEIKLKLQDWFLQFQEVEIWSDHLAYDWVVFCDIFGTAFDIPQNIYYIPFDICVLFKEKGIDPDINREKFGCGEVYYEMPKHNALWDAQVIKMCYDKIKDNESKENILALKEIYSFFDVLLEGSNLKLVDEILKKAISFDLSLSILIAFLTTTKPYKKELENREMLYDKAYQVAVKKIGIEKIDNSIFKNLK